MTKNQFPACFFELNEAMQPFLCQRDREVCSVELAGDHRSYLVTFPGRAIRCVYDAPDFYMEGWRRTTAERVATQRSNHLRAMADATRVAKFWAGQRRFLCG